MDNIYPDIDSNRLIYTDIYLINQRLRLTTSVKTKSTFKNYKKRNLFIYTNIFKIKGRI